MFPLLIEMGPVVIRTYGLLLALGFGLGLWLASVRARKRGIPVDLVLDLGFLLILFGILGARLFYVIQFYEYYLKDPLAMLRIWEGGLVFYGGLVTAMLAGVIYLRRKGIEVPVMADLLAPSLALGQSIGRLGCFAAGCCYGLPWDGLCSVTFTDPLSLAPTEVPRHPTQLYQSGADLGVVLALLALDRKRSFDGQIFCAYLILSPALRFIVEFLRGDERGSFLGTVFSPAQGFGLVLMGVGIGAWIWLQRAAERERGR